jgi:hypothetical protein
MLDIVAGSHVPLRAHAVITLRYKPIQNNVSGQ